MALEIKEQRVAETAIKEYTLYLEIMIRIQAGEADGSGVFLSAEECKNLSRVRYNTDHWLAHHIYGQCRDDEGNPMYVVPGILTVSDHKQN